MINCPKVSVIIPVFNGEQFLDRCLSSITNQSYKDIEIIVINDGSTDNTKAICKNYSQNDQRIKVIHKDNEGVSTARNIGLDIATGDYIYFADADDYVLQDSIENFINKAMTSSAEIIVAEYYIASDSHKMKISPKEFNDKKSFLCSILSGTNHSALWNKLFKKGLFDNIRFNNNIFYMEDKVLLVEILSRIQVNIEILYTPVYIYWQNQDSITNLKDKSILKQFEIYTFLINKLNYYDSDKDIMESFSYGFYKSMYFVLKNIELSFLKQAITIIYDLQKELSSIGLHDPNNMIHKFVLLSIKLPPSLSYNVIKKFRKGLNMSTKTITYYKKYKLL